MDVLLADVVAGEPSEEVPVAELILHFGQAGAVGRRLGRVARVPIAPHEHDIADRAVFQPLDGLEVGVLVMALESDAHLEILPPGLFGGGQDLADAGGVGGQGFFHEGVLARLDGVVEMERPEARGRGVDDHVHAAVDGPLVGVEPDEPPLRRHVDLRLQAAGGALADPAAAGQVLQACLEPVLEGVGHGPELDRPGGAQRLGGGPGAAVSTAEQGHLDFVAAGGMGGSADRQLRGQCCGRGNRRGAFQEVAAGSAARAGLPVGCHANLPC